MRRNTLLCLLALVLAGCGFSTSAEPKIVSTQLLQAVPTATPAPNATEEVSETTQPLQTEEATDAVPTVAPEDVPATIRVTGQISNSGGSAPENVSVKVLSFTFDAEGQPQALLDEQDVQSVGSTYTIEALKVSPDAYVVAQLDYLGVAYTSELTEASRLVDGTLTLPLTVNEITSDTSVINISSVWYIFGASPEEGIAEIFNWYFIDNTSDRVLYSENGAFSLELPKGVTNIQVTSDTAPDRYIINTDGEAPVIIDTNPLRPEEDEILSITYYMPYSTETTLTQTIGYPTASTSIYLSRNFDFALQADGYTDNGVVELRGLGDYQKFDRSTPYNPADVLDFTVSGTRALATQAPAITGGTNLPATTTEDSSFLEENSQGVLIVGIVIVLLGFMLLFWDLQKSRMRLAMEMTRSKADLPQTQDQLVSAIADLDDAFEQGKLTEKEYDHQREALKEQLRRLM